MRINKLIFSQSIFTILVILTTLNFNLLAAVNCRDIEKTSSNPKDIVICGSPDELEPKVRGSSLYDVVMLINNALASLAIFLSIIGVIVGVISLARAQSNKAAYEEAKGTITNSLLAFIITAAVWIIVRLVFNTLGIGALNP